MPMVGQVRAPGLCHFQCINYKPIFVTTVTGVLKNIFKMIKQATLSLVGGKQSQAARQAYDTLVSVSGVESEPEPGTSSK